MKLSIFVPLTVFLSFSAAELTGSNELAGSDEVSSATDDFSPCLNHCLTEAASVAGCASQFDSDCTCPSPAFKDALAACLEAACTTQDQEAAGELHLKRCGTTPE